MRTNINRITSLLLALVMMLSLTVTAFAADGSDIPEGAVYVTNDNGDIVGYYGDDGYVDLTDSQSVDNTDDDAFVDEDLALVTKFSDVKSSAWYYNDVTECAKLGIVAGFEDGTFKPDDKVTDIQLIVMLTRTFYNAKVEAAKKNAAGKPWYWPNTSVASDINLSAGLTLTDKAMNRYDMAKALYNNIAIEGKTSGVTNTQLTKAKAEIADWDNVPSNRRAAVNYCYALGIITGMGNGKFAGTESMTRAQACTVIMRMLKLINNYNPGDKDNDQYDDGTSQDNNQASNTLANGKPITEANVLAILAEIQREYPAGTIWGASGTAGNHYYANGGQPKTDMADLNAKFRSASSNGTNRSSLNYACGGWACMVSERIFGQTGYPFREVTNPKDIRPGDISITFNNKGQLVHYAVVSSSVTSTVINGVTQWRYSTCDGNNTNANNNTPHVKWGDVASKVAGQTFNNNLRVFTRYPA